MTWVNDKGQLEGGVTGELVCVFILHHKHGFNRKHGYKGGLSH